MIDRWVRSHRVGLAAYRLGLPVAARGSKEYSDDEVGLAELWDFLSSELERGIAAYPHFYTGFPPIVLQLLLSLTDGRLDTLSALRPTWKIALDQQIAKNQRASTMPKSLAAQVLAHHILNGTSKPIALMRLGKSILSKSWRTLEEDNDVLEAFDLALGILRSPWSDTEKRVGAIEIISSAMGTSEVTSYVENALYHQIFSWPLLVLTSDIAISLPVGIDVYADGKAEVETRGDQSIDTSKWEQHLWNAADVARVMWLGKHGNFGSERKNEVRGTSVIYDFSVANNIVSNFPERLLLVEPSMEAYFAQVILSRLLGNSVSSSSVVTGSIGQQRVKNYRKLADFEFNWPQGLTEKLKYVFRTKFFERIILPDLHDLAINDPRRAKLQKFLKTFRHEQSTEINFVKHLQNVADAFQVGGWRQFQYVRCPDIAWNIHPSGSRLPSADSPRIQNCLKALQNNTRTVLDLSAHATPLDLAAALWHINTKRREAIPLRQRPPMLSWAFVRAVPGEQDMRFWHVVWKTTGAPREDWDLFHRTATSEAAAETLAAAFNRFSPTLNCPSHRAPDILVLLGTQSLSASLVKTKNPTLRCHAFDPVIDQLNRPHVLRPCLSSFMRSHLGETRFIIFQTDIFAESSSVGTHSVPEIERELLDTLASLRLQEKERELLNALTVFRFGFTQQMASLLWRNLDYGDLPTKDLLEEFVKLGYIRYGFGEYHFPGRMGQTWNLTDNRIQDAKMHYSAGVALAPYLSLVDIPGIALDKAFHPQYVHEAHYHLREAFSLLDKNHSDYFRSVVMVALSRLQRFAEYPGWSSVNQLLKGGIAPKDAYELSLDLIEARENSGFPSHPEHLLTAARATEQWWRHISLPSEQGNGNTLLRQIEELYDKAETACAHRLFHAERDYNRLRVLTQRAAFLLKYSDFFDSKKSAKRIDQLTNESLKLLQAGTDGTAAPGEWYELLGDSLVNHRDATTVYKIGVQAHPDWGQLWIKLIGASIQAYSDRNVTEEVLNTLSLEKLDLILRYSLPGVRRDTNRAHVWVRSRWQSFINLLKTFHNSDSAIQRHLRLYDIELAKWRN